MSEGESEPGRSGAGGLPMARLRDARWTLVAACTAIFLVNAVAGGPWLFAICAAALVCAVCAWAPRRTAAQRAREREPLGGAGIGGLTAEALAGAVSDPLIVYDREGNIVHVNGAARAAFGTLTPGTSLQLRFRAPEMQDLLHRSLAGESASTGYSERVPLERVYRVAATPAGGGFNVLLFKDQSEARRIDRMRADFIANASHELRTPLASIAGFIETLRGPAKNDPAARENFLRIMQDQTSRMARLIDDLLSLSRLEMKPFLSPSERVDVRSVVESVIDTLAPLAQDSGVVVELDVRAGRTTATGNRDELFQVFENLVENACKYGQSGGRVIVTIEEAEGERGRELVVAVRDFGPGIPEEHIPRLTERFYRVDAETSRSHKGTGLGLAIVKHILTRHGARLSIASEFGQGSAFAVHLPAATADAEAALK